MVYTGGNSLYTSIYTRTLRAYTHTELEREYTENMKTRKKFLENDQLSLRVKQKKKMKTVVKLLQRRHDKSEKS